MLKAKQHDTSAVIATVLMVFVPLQVFGQVIYKVLCDYSTPSCECPLQFWNGICIKVCEFEFEITNHYIFTCYQVNTTINTVATGGQLWIIVKIYMKKLCPGPNDFPSCFHFIPRLKAAVKQLTRQVLLL